MTQHASVRSRIGSATVVLALVATAAGCGKAPAGTTAASGTAAPSSPPAATSSPPATAIPTPAPTRLPSPVAGAWVAAGSTVRDYLGARLLALRGGGAVLIGTPLGGDGVALQGILAAELWNETTGWRAGATTDVRLAADASGRSRSDARGPVLAATINGAPGMTFAVAVMRDGRLLVAGGDDGSEHSIASVSIYDPEHDAWTAAAPMGQPRSHASAALLPDGRVLVTGGFAWEPFEDTGRAQGVQPASLRAPLESPERDDTVRLLDVAPYPLGPALATAEVYDPAAGSWAPAGPMRYARTGPAIATLRDGRVLVVGASDEATRIDARAFTTAEVYDPATGTFTSAGTLPAFDRETLARLGVELPVDPPEQYGPIGTLVALPDGGAVFIAQSADWKHGGQVVWSARLAPDLGTWHRIGQPFGARVIHVDGGSGTQVTGVCRAGAVVVGLDDGSVLVGGGSTGTQVPVRAPVSVLRYDPVSDSWSEGPDLPEPRYGSLGVRLDDRTVLLVAGGIRQDGSGGEDATGWPTWRLLPGEWYGAE